MSEERREAVEPLPIERTICSVYILRNEKNGSGGPPASGDVLVSNDRRAVYIIHTDGSRRRVTDKSLIAESQKRLDGFLRRKEAEEREKDLPFRKPEELIALAAEQPEGPAIRLTFREAGSLINTLLAAKHGPAIPNREINAAWKSMEDGTARLHGRVLGLLNG